MSMFGVLLFPNSLISTNILPLEIPCKRSRNCYGNHELVRHENGQVHTVFACQLFKYVCCGNAKFSNNHSDYRAS